MCPPAAEYFSTHEWDEKTDVYAFGVLLVELVSGLSLYELAKDTHAPESGMQEWVRRLVVHHICMVLYTDNMSVVSYLNQHRVLSASARTC